MSRHSMSRQLHVTQTGTGPDLVLLHGWAMHGGVFEGLLPTLSQRYRVHVIDLPGHGRSTAWPVGNALQAWTEAVAEHIPLQAMVLGWSLGGLITMKLAQARSLRAMVLVSTTPRFVASEHWSAGMAAPVFAQFFSRLQLNLATTVQDFLALQVRGDSEAASTLQQLQQWLMAHPADDATLRTGLEILRDADERAALPQLAVPTLVVAGEYDRIAHPRASEYLASQLPQARLLTIQRAGHAPFLSHRTQFLAELQAFLEALPTTESAT